MNVAKLRVAMNEAKEELGKAVAGQDFIRAQEVKATLDGLEEQVVVAEEELRVLKGTSAASGTAARNFSFTVNGSQATAGTTTCHVITRLNQFLFAS